MRAEKGLQGHRKGSPPSLAKPEGFLEGVELQLQGWGASRPKLDEGSFSVPHPISSLHLPH